VSAALRRNSHEFKKPTDTTTETDYEFLSILKDDVILKLRT